MEVVGGGAGTAYVGWLSPSDRRGYALYLRSFSVASGWLGPQQRVSSKFGLARIYPGDTFGLSILGSNRVTVSWGSAVSNKTAEIYATTASFSPQTSTRRPARQYRSASRLPRHHVRGSAHRGR